MLDKNVKILSDLQIDLTFEDVEKNIKTSQKSSQIFETAKKTLEKVQGKWEPAALFQWFDFKINEKTGHGQIIQQSGSAVRLNLGPSIQFLKEAQYVMVSTYTIGQTLDIESANAMAGNRLLEAYMIDLIGLAVLDKTEGVVINCAEDVAKRMGWGVSPFLSPGSVHGWELEQQSKLCSLLPIEQINVTIENNSVLFPLKSVCTLIGIGQGYGRTKVGTACEICNKRATCKMMRKP